MNWNQLGCGIVMGMLSVQASAVEPWAPTTSETASLPPYCKAKFQSGQGGTDSKMWESTLGPDFLHIHHYCAGINFLDRYYRSRSDLDKRFNLNSARGELQYMITHASPTFSLMPDVYLNLGVVYSLMNQTGQAITHFNKAIELDPGQPRAYSALADNYAKSKQTAKALETVAEGLRHNPDTKSLQRRYRELGGKLPYPDPVAKSAPIASPIQAEVGPSAKIEQLPKPANAAEAEVPPATDKPKIGSPKNPYCRFCPD